MLGMDTRMWRSGREHAKAVEESIFACAIHSDMDEIVELAYSWRITYTVDIQTKRRKEAHIHPATHTQSLMLVFQIFVIKSEHCSRSAKSSNAGKAVQNIGISNCNHIFHTILFRLKIYAKRKERIEVIKRDIFNFARILFISFCIGLWSITQKMRKTLKAKMHMWHLPHSLIPNSYDSWWKSFVQCDFSWTGQHGQVFADEMLWNQDVLFPL